VFKFERCLGLCTLRFLIPLYYISCHIGDNVSFKFGGVDKHCLFVCLFVVLFVYICFCLYINFFLFLFCYVIDWA
jgi:hypothetical protein